MLRSGNFYREEPADGGSGQIDPEDWAGCDDVVCGGAGQTDCEASGCVACLCVGLTVMRVEDAAGADAAGAAGGFCAASFGLGFGFGLGFASAVAGGAGPATAASASGCSGGG